MTTSQLSVLEATCRALFVIRGEAASTRLAEQVTHRYPALDPTQRVAFFQFLLEEFSPDPDAVHAAIAAYRCSPGPATAQRLARTAEAPLQSLFRSINTATSGTSCVLEMRTDAIAAAAENPELAPVEDDLAHVLGSWFNRGFLTLDRIDWQTPAAVLEKLIEYEAVHEIRGWDDLRRRLDHDRRCFAFFHPSLPGEPIIFVQVALTAGLASSIHHLLDGPVPDEPDTSSYDTAIFYSISNCQPGLQGIPLGSFLIKRVTERLRMAVPNLTRFATLSPIPGYVAWVRATGGGLPQPVATAVCVASSVDVELQGRVLSSCATYLLTARGDGHPLDPVARFHLRNGARLERLNWAGDTSPKGVAESYGMLVNYLYDPDELDENHEAYINDLRVAHHRDIQILANAHQPVDP